MKNDKVKNVLIVVLLIVVVVLTFCVVYTATTGKSISELYAAKNSIIGNKQDANIQENPVDEPKASNVDKTRPDAAARAVYEKWIEEVLPYRFSSATEMLETSGEYIEITNYNSEGKIDDKYWGDGKTVYEKVKNYTYIELVEKYSSIVGGELLDNVVSHFINLYGDAYASRTGGRSGYSIKVNSIKYVKDEDGVYTYSGDITKTYNDTPEQGTVIFSIKEINGNYVIVSMND